MSDIDPTTKQNVTFVFPYSPDTHLQFFPDISIQIGSYMYTISPKQYTATFSVPKYQETGGNTGCNFLF